MRSLLVFLVCATSVFALAACGQQKSEPNQISAQETAEKYVASQQSGDWATFCDLLDQKSQDLLQSELIQEDGVAAESCRDAIEGSSKQTRDALSKAASVIKLKAVREVGDRVELIASTPDGDKALEMVIEDGTWRVMLVK